MGGCERRGAGSSAVAQRVYRYSRRSSTPCTLSPPWWALYDWLP